MRTRERHNAHGAQGAEGVAGVAAGRAVPRDFRYSNAKIFFDLGLEPTGSTPEALAAIMAADTARWAPIVKASGFSAE